MLQYDRYDQTWIEDVANAACLKLTSERLSEMIDAVGKELTELATLQGVEEEDWQADAIGLDALREDTVGDGLDVEALLSAASNRLDGCFVVPEVLSDSGGVES